MNNQYQQNQLMDPLIDNKIKNKIDDLLNINYDTDINLIDHKLTGLETFIYYFFNILFFTIFLPIFFFPLFISFVKVDSYQGVVITYFGKIKKVIKQPGLYFVLPLFTSRKKINFSLQTMEIKGSHVPDINGSPLNISVVLTFKVNDPILALFQVDLYTDYIHSQSLDVIRKVISRFPYRSEVFEEPSLLNDSLLIGLCMKELLQKKVNVAGIKIFRMELMEFNYSPEIAQSLLQTQQAKAKIEARKYIVEGSVLIVKDAIDRLAKNDIDLDKDTKNKIINNLLTITCSDHGQPVPVLNV